MTQLYTSHSISIRKWPKTGDAKEEVVAITPVGDFCGETVTGYPVLGSKLLLWKCLYFPLFPECGE